jgi:hypothetical protein
LNPAMQLERRGRAARASRGIKPHSEGVGCRRKPALAQCRRGVGQLTSYSMEERTLTSAAVTGLQSAAAERRERLAALGMQLLQSEALD